LKNQNETINKKHTEKEKVAQTVEQDNSTVAKCLADSESYLKEIEDYTSRRKVNFSVPFASKYLYSNWSHL